MIGLGDHGLEPWTWLSRHTSNVESATVVAWNSAI